MLRKIVLVLAIVAISAEDEQPGPRFFVGRTTATEYVCTHTTTETHTSVIVTSCFKSAQCGKCGSGNCRRRRAILEEILEGHQPGEKEIIDSEDNESHKADEAADIPGVEGSPADIPAVDSVPDDVPEIEGSQELEEVEIIGLKDACLQRAFGFPNPFTLRYVSTIHTVCTSLSTSLSTSTNTITLSCNPAFGVQYCN